MPNSRIVSIDPGDVHVGIAVWDGDGNYVEARELSPDDVSAFVNEVDPLVMVIENFRLYAHKNKVQTNSDFKTSQLIGELKALARMLGATIVLQGANVRIIAARSPWGKEFTKKYGKLKNRHAWDAICHGLYYFHFGNGSK